jgi:hypothetical protein
VKHPRGKQKKKGQGGSSERAQTTLVELLALIDAAADDEEIKGIVVRLSPGKQAILYSALQYTTPSLPAPGSAEQPKGRLYALHTLRQILL